MGCLAVLKLLMFMSRFNVYLLCEFEDGRFLHVLLIISLKYAIQLSLLWLGIAHRHATLVCIPLVM